MMHCGYTEGVKFINTMFIVIHFDSLLYSNTIVYRGKINIYLQTPTITQLNQAIGSPPGTTTEGQPYHQPFTISRELYVQEIESKDAKGILNYCQCNSEQLLCSSGESEKEKVATTEEDVKVQFPPFRSNRTRKAFSHCRDCRSKTWTEFTSHLQFYNWNDFYRYLFHSFSLTTCTDWISSFTPNSHRTIQWS